ncbi:MAG: hypothetical protein KBS84_02215 [Treponema sp.]|nr:hypothetical protein [Candidatus Treponema scatequi]
MTSGQKTAVSLLTSVVLFAAFALLAFTGLFSVIDARFYEPGKLTQIQNHLDTVSENYNEYIETLESRFGKSDNSFLKQKSVASYIENKPTDDDVRIRSKMSGDLFSQTPGLLGMRLIDKNGTSIHYSTFSTDVLSRTSEIVSYKNYTDAITLSGEKELPFEKVNSPDSYATGGTSCTTLFDGRDNRIIVSFPFYDRYSAYRGSFVFYVNANDFNRVLLSKKLITFGDTGSLVSGLNVEDGKKDTDYKSGFVFGIPVVGREIFEKEILSRWEQGLTNPEKIVYSSIENTFDVKEYDASAHDKKAKNHYWVLVSSTKTPFGHIGGVYPDEVFAMSDSVKILLLLCIFVTLFLVVFLCINLKQDDMVVIRERIRRLQLGIVSEYLKKKENVDWKVVSGKIAERRQDVTLEIIRSLGRKGKKYDKEVNELVNKSWDELLAAMSVQIKKESEDGLSNSAEIKKMLEELLSSGSIKVQAVGGAAIQSDAAEVSETVPVAKAKPVPVEVKDLSDEGEVEELDEVEELSDAEEITDAEAVEDLEEVEDAEAVEEIGDADVVEDAEAVDVAEFVEEAPEVAEPVEEVEAPEVIDDKEVTEITEELSDEMEDVSIEDLPKYELHAPEAEIETKEDVEKLNRESIRADKTYNSEDDQIIDNFTASALDFSSLDDIDYGMLDDVPLTPVEKEVAAEEEEISVDEFGVSFDEVEQFDEEIGFGSVDNVNAEKTDEQVKFDVEPEAPDFEDIDKPVKVHFGKKQFGQDLLGESSYSIKNIQDEVSSQAMPAEDDIVELTDCDLNVPFALTQFGSVAEEPEEISPFVDVIKEDENGVFEIDTEGQEQAPLDMNFKELVDSVMNNDD